MLVVAVDLVQIHLDQVVLEELVAVVLVRQHRAEMDLLELQELQILAVVVAVVHIIFLQILLAAMAALVL